MVSFKERLRKAQAEIAQHSADPLLRPVEAIVRGQEAIGTAPLLDLLGLPKTTGNGRRLAQTMRSLGFVPIKSRRLYARRIPDTVTRGWARPLRNVSGQGNREKDETVECVGLRIAENSRTEETNVRLA